MEEKNLDNQPLLNNYLLPIGSVVLLNDMEQEIMIYGRAQLQGDGDKLWDYVGCIYPIGYINKDFNVFFDQKQINEVLFRGYENEHEILLKPKLENAVLEKRNK